MRLDLSELQGLLLDGLLQVEVGLVGSVQRHLQLGDLDLELLLDAGDLGFEPSLRFHDTGIELFNFKAGCLAEINIFRFSPRLCNSLASLNKRTG